ncbi:MAG: hypothetical protein RL689_736 [Planctomycetota bacterium]
MISVADEAAALRPSTVCRRLVWKSASGGVWIVTACDVNGVG